MKKRINYPKHRKSPTWNKLEYLLPNENQLLITDFDKQQYQLLIKLIQKYHKLYRKVLLRIGTVKTLEKNKEFDGLLDWIKDKTPVLQKADFEVSIPTMCYWVLHGMTDFPECKLKDCHNKVMEHINIKSLYLGYHEYCSIQCINKDQEVRQKISDTIFNNTGYRNASQDPAIKEKKRLKAQEVYGVDNVFQSEIVKETLRETNRKNYGCNYPRSNPEFQKQCEDKIEEKYGVRNVAQVRKFIAQSINTKILHGTSNGSKQEDNVYVSLCQLYGKDCVKRNYAKDVRYPFACDFFITSIDLFVECNFHWTHGFHWFDATNQKDIAVLDKWKKKSSNGIGSENYYDSAINVWTERDPLKHKIALDNNLNYLVFWSYKEFEQWYAQQNPV